MSLIPNAFAEGAMQAGQSGQFNYMSFLPMVVIFVLFWFLLIRPQQKKAKEHNKMVSELQKGDEVISNSGILGKINKVDDKLIFLEIAENVIIKVQKNTVAARIDKSAVAAK